MSTNAAPKPEVYSFNPYEVTQDWEGTLTIAGKNFDEKGALLGGLSEARIKSWEAGKIEVELTKVHTAKPGEISVMIHPKNGALSDEYKLKVIRKS